jgi:hypothetical protein
LTVGLLGWGGGGIALGLSVGAGIGVALGTGLDATRDPQHQGKERAETSVPVCVSLPFRQQGDAAEGADVPMECHSGARRGEPLSLGLGEVLR